MKILGIESSCDETAVSFISAERNSEGCFVNKKILSNVIFSQIEEHKKFGGVFPEIASRLHLDVIEPTFKTAILESGLQINEIDAVAATCGPGLVGSLVIGAGFGKAIAYAAQKPFIAVNHLIGHAMMPRFLYDDLNFPYLLVLASGGHSLIGVLKSPFEFDKFGSTIDDSAGECFDKVARMIGLPYPGGPNIEKCAKEGNPLRFNFPIPLNNKGCDFSFSGLKTAVLTLAKKMDNLSEQDRQDISASFQNTVAKVFEKKVLNAINFAKDKYPNIKSIVFSGGVAANQYISQRVKNISEKYGYNFCVPPLNMCTDNALMIAWAGMEILSLKPDTNNLDTDILKDNIFN